MNKIVQPIIVIFSYPSVLPYVLGAQMNRVIEGIWEFFS